MDFGPSPHSIYFVHLVHHTKIKILTTSFYDKTEYDVNYRLLKLFIRQGLIIKKVHRVIQYKQSLYMKSYIKKVLMKKIMHKKEDSAFSEKVKSKYFCCHPAKINIENFEIPI